MIIKKENVAVDDKVNSPLHYTQGGIEVIDILQAKLGSDMFQGFLLGNVLKYSLRYRHKNGIEDLKKAQWYLNKLITEQSAEVIHDRT